MTPEEIQQCLEEAFGGMDPLPLDEVFEYADADGFGDVIMTNTARTKRWQELRPLNKYLLNGLSLCTLTPAARQYYLPAYLYGMTDAAPARNYLWNVLGTLFYEDENGDLLFGAPHIRELWEKFSTLLSERQKRCIAHWLREMLRTIDDPSAKVDAEVEWERDRIENMLERYWNAWL